MGIRNEKLLYLQYNFFRKGSICMTATIYGYARVSSKSQCEDRQMIALDDFDGMIKKIYLDKISGADFERPAYKRLIKKLKKGDILVIKSIDRLGRNYEEIQNQWRYLTKEKCVDIVVLDMPLLDTRSSPDDLTGVFIADLVLQILSYVAQAERDNTKQRQAEGIKAAIDRGVKFGRPHKIPPEKFFPLMAKYLNGEISSRKAAQSMNIAQSTFLRWVSLWR